MIPDFYIPLLLPAGLLVGIAFGWRLGRASVDEVLKGSRELRKLLSDLRSENKELAVKCRELVRLLRRRPAAKPGSAARPPVPDSDDAESPSIERPLRKGPPIVLNDAHRRDVRERFAEAGDDEGYVSYPGNGEVNEDEY